MLDLSLGLFSSFKHEPPESDEDEEPLLERNQEEISDERRAKIKLRNNCSEHGHSKKRHLLGCCTSYFTILKSLTTTSIFSLPFMFKNGGWLFSPLILTYVFVCCLVGALKLIESANKVHIYNFPILVEYALGKGYGKVFRIMEGLLSFIHILGPLAFFMKTFYSFFKLVTGKDHNKIIYIFVSIALISPFLWIRRLETFGLRFVLGVFFVFYLLAAVSTILIIDETQNKDWEAGEGW